MDYKSKAALATEVIAYYKEKKNPCKQMEWYVNSMKWGNKDATNYYYIGTTAMDCKKYMTADSALTEYVKLVPDFATAWYKLAQAKDGSDTLNPKQWTAKETYLTYVTKLKPEDVEKKKGTVAEAYFYMVRYYYGSDKKDLGMVKCYLNKMLALNASEFWNGKANEWLKVKEIASATAAAECTQ
jgi:hypothetical protein